MAERLKAFDFGFGKRKHPWELWRDGSIWKVTHGVDFDSDPSVFRNTLHVEARRHGQKVRIRRDEESLVFQFYTPTDGN